MKSWSHIKLARAAVRLLETMDGFGEGTLPFTLKKDAESLRRALQVPVQDITMDELTYDPDAAESYCCVTCYDKRECTFDECPLN